MDLFEDWLTQKNQAELIQRALTDSSYINRLQREKKSPTKVNKELATLGDSILKFGLSIIFFDNCKNITEKKKKYEEDEFLVSVIARKYDLLKYIYLDDQNYEIPQDYNFLKHQKRGKKSPHKFIATAVEAMIGAIYLETKDLEAVIKLIESWTKW
jgi:dsRNA-specific ribonuclease